MKLPNIGSRKPKKTESQLIRENLVQGTQDVISSIENFANTLEQINQVADNERITTAIEQARYQIEDLAEVVKYARKGNQEILRKVEKFRDSGGFGMGAMLASRTRKIQRVMTVDSRNARFPTEKDKYAEAERLALQAMQGMKMTPEMADSIVNEVKPEIVQPKPKKEKVRASTTEGQERFDSAYSQTEEKTAKEERKREKVEQKRRQHKKDKQEDENQKEITRTRKILQRLLVIKDEELEEEKKKKRAGLQSNKKNSTGLIDNIAHFDVFSDLTTLVVRRFEKMILQPILNVISKGLSLAISGVLMSGPVVGVLTGLLVKALIPNEKTAADQMSANLLDGAMKAIAAFGGRYAAKAIAGAALGTTLGPVGTIVGVAGGIALEMFGEAIFKGLFGDRIFDTLSEKISQIKLSLYKFIDDYINPLLKKFGVKTSDLVSVTDLDDQIKTYDDYLKKQNEKTALYEKKISDKDAEVKIWENANLDELSLSDRVKHQEKLDLLRKERAHREMDLESHKNHILETQKGKQHAQDLKFQKLHPDLIEFDPNLGKVVAPGTPIEKGLLKDTKTGGVFRRNADGSLTQVHSYGVGRDQSTNAFMSDTFSSFTRSQSQEDRIREHVKGGKIRGSSKEPIIQMLEVTRQKKDVEDQILKTYMFKGGSAVNMPVVKNSPTVINNSVSSHASMISSVFDPRSLAHQVDKFR